ncbi:competence protein CoiA family protein [Streptomyces sp. NPDC004267]|uniref:competence protein CoiA family protein n=1 Tax=Streptomyces sp. NPDC004267 TaxID=3364694 RepID=UPI0036CBA1C9
MPFTAVHPDAGLLDATQPDLGRGLEWSKIFKARPRVPLSCPECGWGLHAKHLPRRLGHSSERVRFFCHDPGRPPECELSNESWEHHMLKLELAAAARAAGWYAELEVAAQDGTWRADVMVSSPDGTLRMAWEAQLSPITDDDIRARTARYRAEGIRVCWVSPHEQSPNWIDVVPAVRVRAPKERDERWVVDDGLAGFEQRAEAWCFKEEELGRFVRWVLQGQLVPARVLPRYREVTRSVGQETFWLRRERWWTSVQSVRAQDEADQVWQRRERIQREIEARRQTPAAVQRRRRLADLRERRRAEENRRRLAAQRERLRVQADERRRRQEEYQRVLEASERALEEQHAREAAEREEKARRADESARAWWSAVSVTQRAELLAAAAELARHEKLWVEVPEAPRVAESFAYGIPLYSRGAFHSLYGIVRPCPELAVLSPQLRFQRLLVRNAQEAQKLQEAMGGHARITHFDLPDHEQLSLC